MSDKKFDCVRMKQEIQARLGQEHGSRTWTQRNAIIRQSIRNDPHLRRLLADSAAEVSDSDRASA